MFILCSKIYAYTCTPNTYAGTCKLRLVEAVHGGVLEDVRDHEGAYNIL